MVAENKLVSFLHAHKRVIFILLLAMLIRVIPACLFYGSYDNTLAEEMYKGLKSGLKAGDITKFPLLGDAGMHFPGWLWLLLLIGYCSELTGLAYHIIFKFPAIFADIGITILIYKTFLNLGMTPKKSSNSAAYYALNPISVIITTINGQFDTLTIFLCLLAWYLWEFKKESRVCSAIFLGAGVIIKEFPVILFPAFWGKLNQKKERIAYLGYFLLPVFIALFIAYFTTTWKFIPHLIRYTSTAGFWGISLISSYLSANTNNSFFIGLNLFVGHYMRYISLGVIALIWVLCFTKKIDILTSIVLIFSTFYFIAPGGAAQYLVWIVPFAIIKRDAMLIFYTIFVSVVEALWWGPCVVMNDPAGYYLPIKWLSSTRNLFSIFAWFITGIWMYRILKARLSTRER